jgi:hypothetical protein
MPKWAKYLIWVAVALIILVLLKVNLNVGSGGLSITQGLVK